MTKAQKNSSLQLGATELSVADLDYDILKTNHTHGQPIGPWSLHYILREHGHTISAPTIGRRLRELENRGILSPATLEGRRLTPAGQELLKRTEQEHRIQVSTEKLLSSLRSGSRKDIIDQLVAPAGDRKRERSPRSPECLYGSDG